MKHSIIHIFDSASCASRLVLVAALLSLCFQAGARGLTIIHTNDLHSHLEPFCSETSGEAAGGFIEIAALVDSIRKADGAQNVLLLDAGDFSQGTSYYMVGGRTLEVKCLRDMKYDALCLGNHEFDNGQDDLAGRLRKYLPGKMVCANYIIENKSLASCLKPYLILNRAGYRIGIIGILADLSTCVTSKNIKGMTWLDPIEQAQKYAQYLKDREKCDIVICLTHIGFDMQGVNDQKLAAGTSGIDIIIGGHSHTTLSEPCIVNNLEGKGVPVVTDGKWGERLGVLKLSD